RLKLGSHQVKHAYRRTGRYRITLLVTDRAGNVTQLVIRLRVVNSLPKHSGKAKPMTSTSGGVAKPKAAG
ncbi:MAG: PKD domain-containing protein, partial [Solirubrobacterales bacterium]|nr:PKD domain-containing protein [Solirubrobacterales bacterium]